MAYPPEFLKLVDEFIHFSNKLAEGGKDGEVSAAILFAAGRYNAFNFSQRQEGRPGQGHRVLRLGIPQGARIKPGGCCRTGGQASKLNYSGVEVAASLANNTISSERQFQWSTWYPGHLIFRKFP